LHVLSLVDAIGCEDTRHTQPLLRQYGVSKPLLPVHEHNEAEAAILVIERLQRGERVAYVSDAGTPAVSDPGSRLVAAVRAAGFACVRTFMRSGLAEQIVTLRAADRREGRRSAAQPDGAVEGTAHQEDLPRLGARFGRSRTGSH
jgi:hypothetical protein